ncbi:MAG: hypothetical protein K2Q22_06140 [Cytophagales bacterium]|nr:hypothetical protein [Cytophagales bacterium]
MFYFYWKNAQERPFAYWVKINRKECWFKDGRPVNGSEDSESSDNSFYYYLLHVTSIAQWEIYPDRLIKIENEGKKRIIRLNSSLFQHFEAGEEVFFVYSPANDLLGYLKSHELILFGNKTINGKAISQTSIPQELVYPPEDGFELVSISTVES